MSRRIGNLPAEVSSFIGRRTEMSEVKRLLGESRLVTLTGVGGVGKTRLALRVASGVRDDYQDGVWLIDLAKLTHAEALAGALADTLEIREHSTRPAMDVLGDHLRDWRALLVLDNCEHLRDSCALLVDRLLSAAPGLRILATSRQELGTTGEHVLDVAPLSLPAEPTTLGAAGDPLRYEAVALFVERAAQRGNFTLTEHNRDAVVGICRRLDGIPLAIELATVRLRALSPQQILDRLDRGQRLLAGGPPTAAPRHQTLHALLDWSYELCSPAERLLWARCSVFAGGFDLAAAEAVCAGGAIQVEDTVDVIDNLVDKSILVVRHDETSTHFRLLETIRQYGRTQLDVSGERAALRRRHRDYYQRLAAMAADNMFGPGHIDWLARLRRDQANLRVALEYCQDTKDGHTGQRIAADLRYHWVTGFSPREGRHWLDHMLAITDKPTATRADALWVSSWLAIISGDFPAARAMVAQGKAVAQQACAVSALGYLALFAGQLAMQDGHLDEAIAHYREALAIHQARGDPDGIVMTFNRLSLAYSALGDGGAAMAAGENSRALCESRGDTAHKSYALWVLGIEWWRRGDTAQALALQRESMDIRRQMGDLPGLASTIEVLSWIAATDGQYERAAELLGISRSLRESVGIQLSGWGHLATFHDRCESEVRAAIGEDTYRVIIGWAAGCTFDQAVDTALGRSRRSRPATTPTEVTVDGQPPELTRRETQVARLVAEGRSNRDIASTLAISQRTAEAHVANILSKLRANSRSQIAAWAAR
jgi:predicted ATPase/DNA-binding CsgD family transcriptional regulator